jgi:hypothetical protein
MACALARYFLPAALLLFPGFVVASPLRSSLSSGLSSEALSLRLGLDRGASLLRLGLDARGETSFYSGCLELSSPATPGLRFAAGPGSPSGSLRFLADPLSPSPLSASPKIEVDGSLTSRRAVLGLDAGPLSFFALGEGKGPVAFSSRPFSARSLGSGSGGCSLKLEALGMEAEFLGAALFAEDARPGEGWRPEPSSSPALGASEGGSPLFDAALLLRREAGSSSSLAAAGFSWGRLAGEAAALRLESRERSGPLELALRAGAAAPRFRGLAGEKPDKLLAASATARLELAGSSSLSASLAAEAESRGSRYAPLWGEEGSASLSFPLVLDSGRFFATSFSLQRSAEGEVGGSWSCSVERRARGEGGFESARASSKLRWAEAIEGLDLAFSSELRGPGELPALGLELSLRLFDQDLPSSPVVASLGASLALPFGKGARLVLEASAPSAGIELSPRVEGGRASALEFSLRYKARAAFE